MCRRKSWAGAFLSNHGRAVDQVAGLQVLAHQQCRVPPVAVAVHAQRLAYGAAGLQVARRLQRVATLGRGVAGDHCLHRHGFRYQGAAAHQKGKALAVGGLEAGLDLCHQRVRPCIKGQVGGLVRPGHDQRRVAALVAHMDPTQHTRCTLAEGLARQFGQRDGGQRVELADHLRHGVGLQPRPLDHPAGKMMVVPVPMQMLTEISTLRIAIPNTLKDPTALDAVRATLQGCVAKYPGGALPELDVVEDMGIDDVAVAKAVAAERGAKARMAELAAGAGAGLDVAQVEADLRKKAQMMADADEIEAQMKKSQLTNFQTESKARLAVLRKLGHIDDQSVVTLKVRQVLVLI